MSQCSSNLRGPECPYEKPKGEFRILALGNSFCEGYSVESRDHSTQRLQDTLNGQNDGHRYRPDLNVTGNKFTAKLLPEFINSVALNQRPTEALSGMALELSSESRAAAQVPGSAERMGR